MPGPIDRVAGVPLTNPSISLAEYHAMEAAAMRETPFQELIIEAAKREGWLAYHTHDSRRSEPGYPDLHLVHAGHGLSLFRELKTMKGTATADQKKWLAALTNAGQDAAIWRPIHWFDGTITAALEPDRIRR